MEAGASVARLLVAAPTGRYHRGVSWAKQPEREVERKGPAVASGIGSRRQADQGPARASRAPAAWRSTRSSKMHDGKAEYFVFRIPQGRRSHRRAPGRRRAGRHQETAHPEAHALGRARRSVRAPGARPRQLHGTRVVPGEVLGLQAGNRTRGHRFMGAGELRIEHARDYAEALETQGAVIASFDARRRDIAAACTGAQRSGRHASEALRRSRLRCSTR